MQRYISFIGYFEFYTKFSNLVQWAIFHYNLFKYLFKTSTKIRGGKQEHIIPLCAKIQGCSLKILSESTSFPFWTNLIICAATMFLLALQPLIISPTCRQPYQIQEHAPIGLILVHEIMSFISCPELEFCKTCTSKFPLLSN